MTEALVGLTQSAPRSVICAQAWVCSTGAHAPAPTCKAAVTLGALVAPAEMFVLISESSALRHILTQEPCVLPDKCFETHRVRVQAMLLE